MKSIFEFAFPNKQILIIGKGPSYARRREINENLFFTIGINQVPNVDCAHFIDWEVFDFNRPMILSPYKPLLHRRPHTAMVPDMPFIWCYNFYTHEKVDDYPVIGNDQFSIHCILRILGEKGIRDVCTLGIDGGFSYNHNFDEKFKRPEGYDQQFNYIQKIKDTYGIKTHAL